MNSFSISYPKKARRSLAPCLEMLENRTLLRSSPLASVADSALASSVVMKFGPLVQVSSLSPFAESTADNVPGQPGTNYLNAEVEPSMAADPLNPKHLVGAWQQDRWSNGGSRDLVTGVTYDGGLSWTISPVPGATLVAGGIFQRASDPWVSIGPDGSAYLAVYAFDSRDSNEVMLVYKSSDGGSTWETPTTLIRDSAGNVADDKESVTADPNDPHFAYYTWDRLNYSLNNGPAYFSRTTDGGMTWEPARDIYGDERNTQTIGNQIVVTPDGTVLDAFTFFDDLGGTSIQVIRSTDHGATWSAPITVAALEPMGVTDPGNRAPVRTGGYVPAIAVDHRNGTLYVVWEDGSFSRFTHDSIGLSLSKDGGLTWSKPIQVNKTPTNISSGKQQAFTPSVAVAANGNVAVTYYDLRNPDNQSGGLPADYWIVFGRGSQDLANPNNWQSEERLTNSSFNVELAPFARGYFVGDYMGLSAGGVSQNSFSALFGQTVSSSDPASIFFRDPALDDSPHALRPSVDPQIASGAAGTRDAVSALIADDGIARSQPWQGQITPLEIVRLDRYFASGFDPAFSPRLARVKLIDQTRQDQTFFEEASTWFIV